MNRELERLKQELRDAEQENIKAAEKAAKTMAKV